MVCFTHQYKNSTQFRLYASLIAPQNTNQKKTSDRFRANDSTCTVMLYEKSDADVTYRLQIEQVGTLSYLKTNKAGQIITRTELANLG